MTPRSPLDFANMFWCFHSKFLRINLCSSINKLLEVSYKSAKYSRIACDSSSYYSLFDKLFTTLWSYLSQFVKLCRTLPGQYLWKQHCNGFICKISNSFGYKAICKVYNCSSYNTNPSTNCSSILATIMHYDVEPVSTRHTNSTPKIVALINIAFPHMLARQAHILALRSYVAAFHITVTFTWCSHSILQSIAKLITHQFRKLVLKYVMYLVLNYV